MKSLDGALSASQIDVRVSAEDIANSHMVSFQGVVAFTNDTMSVQLEVPNELPTGEVLVPYYLNGTYQITNVSPE